MKLSRGLTFLVLLGATTLAHALDIEPYSAAALAAAEQAGKPVALHFHADWCPTCRAQVKSLAVLKKEPGLDLTLLTADYDKEKDLKRRFKVTSQSTLVVLKGRQESARLVGDSSVDGIRTALKSAL